jgi:hypothetical protein
MSTDSKQQQESKEQAMDRLNVMLLSRVENP